MSHPSWVRGLKLKCVLLLIMLHYVAPLVGAWIETWKYLCREGRILVAPLVGAWIETWLDIQATRPKAVAPLVGAWIETNGD